MFKYEAKFTDFNGEEQEEEVYFHLSKTRVLLVDAELDEMFGEGGLAGALVKAIATENRKMLLTVFKTLVLWSYGEKSPDGRRFVQGEAQSSDFESSPVFDEVFYKMASDEDFAATFIKEVVPDELSTDVEGHEADAERVIAAAKQAAAAGQVIDTKTILSELTTGEKKD